MDTYIEREFSIGDIMKLNINRNDFDDLGSVLEMKFSHLLTTSHLITMSFYSSDKIQIHQNNLLMLCNYENVLFDNVLIISSLSKTTTPPPYQLKFLNKEITYMKLYITSLKGKSNYYSFTSIFDLKEMQIVSNVDAEILQLNSTGLPLTEMNDNTNSNENLALILSELDKVNQSLIIEKEKVDKDKRAIEEDKKQITKMVIEFKKEMLLFGDKCYGECVNEVNAKLNDMNKKMLNVETNVMNKYRIIKEKLKNANNVSFINSNNSSQNVVTKDKVANLEIKIKFLEDSNNALKLKYNEKEEKIKSLITQDEKNIKIIKKLKDDIVLLQSQLKDKKDKSVILNSSSITTNTNIPNTSITSTKTIPKKKNTSILTFEITKHQTNSFNKTLLYDLLMYNFTNNNNINILSDDKEITSLSIMLMNIACNPINYYNKYDHSHIALLIKLLPFYSIVYNNNSLVLALSSTLNEYIIKFPEFKSNIMTLLNNLPQKGKDNIIINPIISIMIASDNKINIDISECIYTRANAFDSFIQKAEYKTTLFAPDISNISSSNNNNNNDSLIIKYTSLANSLLCILFAHSIADVNIHINNILNRYLYTKDINVMKFLEKIQFWNVVIKILNRLTITNKNNISSHIKEFVLSSIDVVLILYANGFTQSFSREESHTLVHELFEGKHKTIVFEIIKEIIGKYEEGNITANKIIVFLSVVLTLFTNLRAIISKELGNNIKALSTSFTVLTANQTNTNKTLHKNINVIKSLI